MILQQEEYLLYSASTGTTQARYLLPLLAIKGGGEGSAETFTPKHISQFQQLVQLSTSAKLAQSLGLDSTWPCNCRIAKSRGRKNHESVCAKQSWRAGLFGNRKIPSDQEPSGKEQIQKHFTHGLTLPTEGEKLGCVGEAKRLGGLNWVFKKRKWVEDRKLSETAVYGSGTPP